MDIAVTFEKPTDPAELAPLRQGYLESLPATQESLIEVQIPSSTGYLILHQGAPIGHAFIREGAVLEFWLIPSYAVFGQTVFDQLLSKTGASRALVKSFDALFFSSCVDRQRSLRSLGLLVRDYVRRPLPEHPELHFATRTATLADLDAVLSVEQEIFTVPERLRFVIEQGLMILFEREGELLGFGIMRPVVPGQKGVDIGIALRARFRKQSYSAHFLQHMADACLARGFVPIASCSVENKTVRAAGERIGMFALHRLLELSF